MKTKSVEWSYPTSPNAKRFGFKATGCWVVEIQYPGGPVAIKGFADQKAALENARALPLPWCPIFAKHNPQDCA